MASSTGWLHISLHLIVVGQHKRPEEREYLQLVEQQKWSSGQLERSSDATSASSDRSFPCRVADATSHSTCCSSIVG